MTTEIPVILTHIGLQDYVGVAIEQAKRHNDRVVLIGDCDRWRPVEFYQSEDYWEGAAEFARVYHHMSGNPYGQELYCFQIYFMLRDWCRAHDIERVFTMDSDVMLYCDVTEYEKTLGDYDLAINWCERQEPYRWSACLHNSFWKLATLEAMCDFIMEVYGNTGNFYMLELVKKWAWHQDKGVPGGICDMTLLHFFRQGRKAVNLSQVRDGSVWDDNINRAENYEADEYIMSHGHKLVDTVTPSGFNLVRKLKPHLVDLIKANAIHFQGQAKGLMEEYKG